MPFTSLDGKQPHQQQGNSGRFWHDCSVSETTSRRGPRDDVAKVLCEAVVGQQKGEVNLGSGQATSVLDVAKLLLEIFNADPRLIENATMGSPFASEGFSPVDITRARDWFGFHPTSLRDGLERWLSRGKP